MATIIDATLCLETRWQVNFSLQEIASPIRGRMTSEWNTKLRAEPSVFDLGGEVTVNADADRDQTLAVNGDAGTVEIDGVELSARMLVVTCPLEDGRLTVTDAEYGFGVFFDGTLETSRELRDLPEPA